MSQYDPNLDPNVEINRIPPTQPVYTETIETVVVRPESNTGWWVAGILAAAVLIAVFWILASGGNDDADTEAQLRLAEAEVAQAQADADRAVVQGQIAGAQQSVDFARADAARAQADAARAVSEARAAQAEASRPVIIEAAPAPAPTSTGPAVVTTTSPQP